VAIENTRPAPFPVRHLEGTGWQVLLDRGDRWLTCHEESDARTIAQAAVLEYEALNTNRSGEDSAAELDLVSTALARYHIGFGSRFFHRQAQLARGEH
jgi:hypothetical protein